MAYLRKLPTFKGLIVEGGEVVGFGHFESIGFWTGEGGKHIASYVRTEDGEEVPTAQFSRAIFTTDEGIRVNLFYIESYDDNDFNGYIEKLKQELKARKEARK